MVCQKYRSICDAFGARYGGHVRIARDIDGPYPLWTLTDRASQRCFENRAFPYLIEKHAQAALILAATPANWLETKARLAQLKGGRLLLLRNDETGGQEAFDLEALEAVATEDL